MAYNEGLADRLRAYFESRHEVVEKKMFGGLAFMLNGHMCVGINDNSLMARVGPDQYQVALVRPHAREMDFTGRSLKGFVYVGPDGVATDAALASWVDLCVAYIKSLPPK